MVFVLKVCWKAICYPKINNLHPTWTDFAAQVGRKGSGHPVLYIVCFTKPQILIPHEVDWSALVTSHTHSKLSGNQCKIVTYDRNYIVMFKI